MKIEIRYFAWVRERVGAASETLETEAATIADLIAELSALSEGHRHAFSDPETIRAALDQTLVDMDAPIAGAHEVAFFPPMTGG